MVDLVKLELEIERLLQIRRYLKEKIREIDDSLREIGKDHGLVIHVE